MSLRINRQQNKNILAKSFIKEEKKMTAIIAKVFIIMTLVFEAITITTGTALYPVFTAAAAIIFGCLVIQAAISRIHTITAAKSAFSAG